MMLYLQLFYEFFKAGLFAVGGGMATIPFLYDISDKTGWFTHQELANMIAVGESTPGPIGVNMATYVGFVTGNGIGGVPAGILGAVVATLGLVTPSVIVILIVAAILKSFRNNPMVDRAFYGLRPASAGLIAAAGYLIFRLALLDLDAYSASGSLGDLFRWKAWVLAAVLLILTNLVPKIKKIHPIFFILASALVGIVFAF